MLTATEARKLLRYDPETGYLYWRESRGRVKAGARAGTKTHGYIQVEINRVIYKAHRLIWLMIYGKFPPKQIDHQNQIRDDNRLGNLRAVDNQTNCRNRSLQSNNTSGVPGVSWGKRRERWETYIWVDGIKRFLGYFNDFDEAVKMRKSVERKYGFHPNHGLAVGGA